MQCFFVQFVPPQSSQNCMFIKPELKPENGFFSLMRVQEREVPCVLRG